MRGVWLRHAEAEASRSAACIFQSGFDAPRWPRITDLEAEHARDVGCRIDVPSMRDLPVARAMMIWACHEIAPRLAYVRNALQRRQRER